MYPKKRPSASDALRHRYFSTEPLAARPFTEEYLLNLSKNSFKPFPTSHEMAARKAREEAANMSMYLPGMSSARQTLPPHFDALSPIGRNHQARPLVQELSFDSYDSKMSSRGGHGRDRSSDRNNYDNRRSRDDYDDHSSRSRYSSRDRNNGDRGRGGDDFRSQNEWEEHRYRKKTRY